MRFLYEQLERAVRLVVWLFVVVASYDCKAQTQESPVGDFELRRVFIPQEDLQLMGPEHVPVALEELEKLLAERRRLKLASALESIDSLEDAIYVGEVIGNELISKASRFRFLRSNEEFASIPISPCTLAIGNCEFTLEQLAKHASDGYRIITGDALRSTVNGQLQLNMAGSSDWWFSWSSRGQATGRLVRFVSNSIIQLVSQVACY